MTALGVSLFLSALNVKYRDVGNLLPFLTQVWMYASPVIYPSSIVPERWRLLYSFNPIVGVIEGFRWALLGKDSSRIRHARGCQHWGGHDHSRRRCVYFRQTERTFADVI